MDSLKGVDVVIHLAAIPHPFLKGLTEDDYYRMNVDGSKAVIDAVIESKIKKFIFTSSGATYGFWGGKCMPEKFPIDESNYIPSLEEGNSPYGISKVLVEKYLKEVSEQHKWFNTYCLRIEGPGSTGVRLEWINGLHNLDDKATVWTCPAHHFFAEISRINLWQIFQLCIEKDIDDNFLLINCGNEYIHWSINVQEWLEIKYPNVPNETTGNQALYSIQEAKSKLGYKPYQLMIVFHDRGSMEGFIMKECIQVG